MPSHTASPINSLKRKQGGFTFIELLVVMIIIGILATIAIMQVLTYREHAYNAMLQSDLRSIYIASKQFFIDHPNDPVDESDLEEYGYVKSDEDINLAIDNGSENGLKITATHRATPNVYQVDSAGRVSKVSP